MFASYLMASWVVATMAAIVAGAVGFFVVLRGSAFVADAVPQGAFAGAAGANLLGYNTLSGLAVFALGGALGIGWLGRRSRHDVATALALVVMLGLGSLFLSFGTEYAPEIYALLFGQILGVATSAVGPVAILAVASLGALALIYRPLLLSSISLDLGEARGVRGYRIEMAFLVVVALATAMALPVVGALLIFSLMIGPPAAARSLTARPLLAMELSMLIAVTVVWASIAASFLTNWPVGFFVGTLAAVSYAAGRAWAAWRRRQARALPSAAATTMAVTWPTAAT
jgi:zinc/manganese transport system permease protein